MELNVQKVFVNSVVDQPTSQPIAVFQPSIVLPLGPPNGMTMLQSDCGDDSCADEEFECGATETGTMAKGRWVLIDFQGSKEFIQGGRIGHVEDRFIPQGLSSKNASGNRTHASDSHEERI